MRPLNSQVLALLQAGDLESVAALAAHRRGVLSALTALSYHPDEALVRQALRAFGLSAARLAPSDPEAVRIHLRRLFWLVNDESGGIGWRAPELIGEALACCPGQFDEFVSPLVHLLDLEAEDAPRFRPGVLAAITRLAPLHPQVLPSLITSHLQTLAGEIGPRPPGSAANQRAAAYILAQMAAAGLQVEALPFDCLDWELQGASLALDGRPLPGFANPYTHPCDLEAPFILLGTLSELESADLQGRVAVLHGELAKEPLMPKNFTFWNPEEHQAIIRALESLAPLAVAAVSPQETNPAPVFEDGDFTLPSFTLPASALPHLQAAPTARLRLACVCTRRPAQGQNPIGRTAPAPAKIVLSAHLDTKPGTPGALDNAAGVAAILALAARLGPRPPHGLQLEFIAFNGEDYFSAPGQMAYLSQYGARLGEVTLNINLDGLAAAGRRTTLALFECSPALESVILETARGRADLLQTEPWPMGDHMLFVMSGRPALAITSENAMELVETLIHTPADTVACVDPHAIARTVEYLETLLRRLPLPVQTQNFASLDL